MCMYIYEYIYIHIYTYTLSALLFLTYPSFSLPFSLCACPENAIFPAGKLRVAAARPTTLFLRVKICR